MIFSRCRACGRIVFNPPFVRKRKGHLCRRCRMLAREIDQIVKENRHER